MLHIYAFILTLLAFMPCKAVDNLSYSQEELRNKINYCLANLIEKDSDTVNPFYQSESLSPASCDRLRSYYQYGLSGNRPKNLGRKIFYPLLQQERAAQLLGYLKSKNIKALYLTSNPELSERILFSYPSGELENIQFNTAYKDFYLASLRCHSEEEFSTLLKRMEIEDKPYIFHQKPREPFNAEEILYLDIAPQKGFWCSRRGKHKKCWTIFSSLEGTQRNQERLRFIQTYVPSITLNKWKDDSEYYCHVLQAIGVKQPKTSYCALFHEIFKPQITD